MPNNDVRISAWDLTGSAGMTHRLVFTSADALSSLSVFVGGTVTDVDSLTGATEYAGALSVGNTVATVDVVVPALSQSTPLRLVVNGVVQTVGKLHPRSSGIVTPDNTITLTPGEFEFDLTILGVVMASESMQDLVGAMFTGNTETGISATYDDSDGTIDLVAEVTQAELDAEAATRAAADTALDGRLDTIEAISIATDAELAAEAALARNADNLTSGTVADARIASTIARDSEVTAAVAAEATLARNADNLTSGTVADARIASTIARDSEVTAAVSASEAGQVRDGDAAGGVLGGTYPNPSFAADMATQAELDAEAALARNADNLTSGTVADARIASTIARDSEVTAAISTHEAAADPHTGYLKEADAASTYAPLSLEDWTSFTPSFGQYGGTTATLGNGTLTGSYNRIGDLVTFRISFAWGSTTVHDGFFLFGLPVAMVAGTAHNFPIQGWAYVEDFATAPFMGWPRFQAGGGFDVLGAGTGGSASNPFGPADGRFTWATGDFVNIAGSYRCAP